MLQIENQRDRLKQIAVQKAGVWQQQRKRRGGTGDEIQKAIERPFLQQRCKQAHKQVGIMQLVWAEIFDLLLWQTEQQFLWTGMTIMKIKICSA